MCGRRLSLTVEDDEHLLALVVKVVPNATFGWDAFPVEEVEVGIEVAGFKLRLNVDKARTVVRRFRGPGL
jgi:hypothetical protein